MNGRDAQGDASGADAVLESNLRALLLVAWRPVEIRPGFASEVQRLAEARLAAAATRPSWGRRLGLAALASAASFLLTAFLLGAWAGRDGIRDQLLAHGTIAARSNDGPWRGAPGSEPGARFVLESGTLDLALPDEARASVVLGQGAAALLGPGEARFTAAGPGAELELGAARLSLRGFQGSVHGAFGRLETSGLPGASGADLDLCCDREGGLRARLTAGLARWEGPSGELRDLALGVVFETGEPVLAQQGSGSPQAVPSPGGSSPSGSAVDPTRVPIPYSVGGSAAVSADGGLGTPRRLAGSVQDPSGRTVDDFQVLVLPEVELPRTADPRAARYSAAGGRFVLEDAGSGPTTVFVQAEGFALWTRQHLSLGQGPVELDVRLQRGSPLEGRVLEAGSGVPLVGAVIVSERDVPGSLLAFDVDELPGNPAALTRSGPDGRFRFDSLAPGTTVLRAWMPGHGPRWSAPLTLGAAAGPDPQQAVPEVLLELGPGGLLEGRVEREDGSPWPGVGVIAMPQPAVFSLPRRSYGISVTDGQGRYRIQDLPPGACVVVRVDLSAGRPDSVAPPEGAAESAGTEVRETRISAGATSRVDFLASPRGSRFAGRVLSADQRALPGVNVSIIPVPRDGESESVARGAWRSQSCAADGSFEFTEVEPGRYEVYLGVRAPMDVVHVDHVEIGLASNVDRVLVAPGGELRGRLRGAEDGAPASQAFVVLERDVPGAPREFAAKVQSDDAGRWRVPYLRPGTYALRAYPRERFACAGRDGLIVGASPASEELALELGPAASLSLIVRDAAGLPAPGVELRLFDEQGLGYEPAWGVRSGARGEFSLHTLPAGRVRIEALAPDGRKVGQEVLCLPGGTQSLELQLPAAQGKRED